MDQDKINTAARSKPAKMAAANAKKVAHGLTTELVALGRAVHGNSGKLKADQVEQAKALVANVTRNVKPMQGLLMDLWKIANALEGRAKENMLYERLDLDRHYCMLAGAWSMWGMKVIVPAIKTANPILVANVIPSFDDALQVMRQARPAGPSNPSKLIIPGQ